MLTSKLPSHFVDFLTKPGLKTRAGIVPLNMYMGSHKNGANSAAFFDALGKAKLHDLDYTWWTPEYCVPAKEWGIMVKGQGWYQAYADLWSWLWENQEQLDNSKFPYLQKVYNTYFAGKSGAAPLIAMVKDAYFGNECIGFVSNYLRWIGYWKEYNGLDNHHWKGHYSIKIQSLADVQPLDLLEWTKYGHIALVDEVYGITKGVLTLDVSQCSGFTNGPKGPMSNKYATLSLADKDEQDYVTDHHTVFTLGGNVPVQGPLQVRRHASVTYSSPRYRNAPSSDRNVKDDSFNRK